MIAQKSELATMMLSMPESLPSDAAVRRRTFSQALIYGLEGGLSDDLDCLLIFSRILTSRAKSEVVNILLFSRLESDHRCTHDCVFSGADA